MVSCTSVIHKAMIQPNNKPSLSIVILCYRSEEGIIGFLRAVEDELRIEGLEDYELVLVANYIAGRSDKTPDIVRQVASENPRNVISHEDEFVIL